LNRLYSNTRPENKFLPQFADAFKALSSSRLFPYVVFMLCIYAVYAQSIFYGISGLDDFIMLVQNLGFYRDPHSLITAFSKNVFFYDGDSYYRPLLTVSIVIDTLIGKGALGAYHFSNVLYHFIAVCVLFNLLKNLDFTKNKAFVFTSFFAVSSVISQAVAWIPGRNDVLLGIFIFTSFIYIIKFNKSGVYARLFTAAFFFAAAMLTKETAAVAFFVFALYMCMNRTEDFGKKTAAFASLFLAIIFIWYMMKKSYSANIDAYNLFSIFKKSIKDFIPVTLQYIGKIFFPMNLKVVPLISSFDKICGIFFTVFLAGLIYFSKAANPRKVFFGAVIFIAFLYPTYFNNPFLYEHRMYVPLLGVLIVLNEVSIPCLKKRHMTVFLCAYFMFFACVSFINSIKFQNKDVFASSARVESQTSVSYYCSFLAFFDLKLYEMSEYFVKKDYYSASQKQRAGLEHEVVYIGYFEWLRGKFDAAEKILSDSVKKRPNADGYSILADIYLKENKFDLALENIKKAIKINPESEAYQKFLIECVKRKKIMLTAGSPNV